MDNPVPRRSMKPILIGGMILLWAGLIFLFYSETRGGFGTGLFVLILIVVPWVLSILVVYSQNRAIPYAINIEPGGFMAHFGNGKEKHYDWDDIEFVDHVRTDSSQKGNGKKSNRYCLKQGNPVYVDSEISRELRESYKEKKGKYPPSTRKN